MNSLPNWLDLIIKQIDEGDTRTIWGEPVNSTLGLIYSHNYDEFHCKDCTTEDGDIYEPPAENYRTLDDETNLYFEFSDWLLWGNDYDCIFIQLPEQLQQYFNPIYKGAYKHP